MSWVIDDLAINVVPEQLRACLWLTRICIRPTFWCCPRYISYCGFFTWCRPYTPCPRPSYIACEAATQPQIPCAGGSELPEMIDRLTPVINPVVLADDADIKVVKGQLQQVLGQLEELERTGIKAAMETTADLPALEERLKKALSDVQARRKAGGK